MRRAYKYGGQHVRLCVGFACGGNCLFSIAIKDSHGELTQELLHIFLTRMDHIELNLVNEQKATDSFQVLYLRALYKAS